jgi:HPt (histidine-containing phosphotransfer) domain-containing protein
VTWWQTAILGAMSVAAAYLTARITARSSDRAAERTTEVQRKASDVDGLDRLATRLEGRLDRVEEDLEAAQREIAELRDALHTERTLFSTLLEYCRVLRRVMRAHAVVAPEPPPSLVDRI